MSGPVHFINAERLSGTQIHIIRKQVADLVVEREKNARTIQDQFSNLLKNKLNTNLDNLFSSVVPADKHLRIDKLEIDLGKIDRKEIKDQLTGRIIKAIEHELSGIVADPGKPHGHTIPDSRIRVNISGLTSKDKQGTVLEHFFHFLHYGSFPSLSAYTGFKQFEDQLTEFLNTLTEAEADKITRAITSQKSRILRLTHQFSLTFQKKLIVCITKFTETVIEDIMSLLFEFYEDVKISIPFEKYSDLVFTSFFISLAERDHIFKWEAVFLQRVLDGLSTGSLNITPAVLKKQLSGFLKTRSPVNSSAEILVLIEGLKEDTLPLKKPGRTALENERDMDVYIMELFTEGGKPGTETDVSELTDEKEEDEPGTENIYYINNAGIVLLAPFLPELFAKLNLINENNLPEDSNDLNRAVQFTQYLVSGEQNTHEHLLVLNKILCGISIQYPVRNDMFILKKEMQLCDRLLRSIIADWKILKNTTPGGLRINFLQREGRLTESERGWELYIERKGIDIVLNSIPWNYSFIKLPWMKKILFVEW